MIRTKGAIKTTSRGSKILPSGVKITKGELDEFKKLVRSINSKRSRIEKKEKPSSTVQTTKNAERGVVFKPPKRSSNLKQFATREQFEEQMRYLRKVRKIDDYAQFRSSIYRDNIKKAINNVYGNSGVAWKLKRALTKMPEEAFRHLLKRYSDVFSVNYVYFEQDDSRLSNMLDLVESVTTAHSMGIDLNLMSFEV